MMEGENVKALAPPFNLPLPRGSTPSPDPSSGACAGDQKSFDEFIRHQIQALIFCYFFIKEKVKALRWLTEASPCNGQENSDRFKVPACAGSDNYRMTIVL